MNTAELIIVSVYALLVLPALLVPLFWAAVLDGRYQLTYVRRRAQDGAGRIGRTRVSRPIRPDMHAHGTAV